MSKKLMVVCIVLLAAVLRFSELGKLPPSLNLDEVAIGYNAYSVLKTGRDEYGKLLPMAFRSHDDYKPPLYVYLTVPSVAVFGLNEFAVRFPSALAGTLTVLLTYFLVKELFPDNKWKMADGKWNISLPALAAVLLAVSPWHLQFSRAAYEANVAVLFVVLTTWAFLRAAKGAGKFWYLVAVSTAAALYTYQAARVFLPLFIIVLAVIFREGLKTRLKQMIVPAILFIVLVAPLIPVLTSEAGLMRLRGTSVFEHPGLIETETQRAMIDASRRDGFAMKLFHNRRLAAVLTLAQGYLVHFRPDVLFLGNWGPPVNFTPNVGILYLIELPLIIWGAHAIMKLKDKKAAAVVLSWVALAPLAPAFTYDVPSSVRMTIILPSLQILAAVGILEWISASRKATGRSVRWLPLAFLLAVYVFSALRYLHMYRVHAPIEYADAWQYGYKEAVEYASEHRDEYDRIIVSTNLRQPQNFFAFYTQYDPWTYILVDGGTVSGGFLESRNRFGKYEFHEIAYDGISAEARVLLVDSFNRMDARYRENAVKIITLPNGEPTIAISAGPQ